MSIELDLSRWSGPQREAIEVRGQNVLVSAGAGSGKTSVLVERVVHCITGPQAIDVNRLLVVTFTEAAAGEMRKRIVDRLQELLATAAEANWTEDVRQLQRQMQMMDQAQISTLHSFCMQVVRRNFLHLGIEPKFDLLAVDDALLIRTSLLEDVVEQQLGADDNEQFREMIVRFAGGNPRHLEPLVFRLDEFARSQTNPDAWLATMRQRFADASCVSFADLSWSGAFMDWVTRRVQQALMSFREGQRIADGQDELASYASNLRDLAEMTVQIQKCLAQEEALESAVPYLLAAISLKGPRAGEHPDKERVKACRTDGLDLLKTVHEVLSRGTAALQADIVSLAPYVSSLIHLVTSFQNAYEKYKRQSGVLDFQDLEHLAYRAIHDAGSGEAFRLREQFAEIFVDEYQDTSPIQDSIVAEVARREGNVFVVGDVKQSIYRFRMAEPNLFLGKYRTLGRDVPGKVIDLVANYRSRAGVVDAINFVFRQLFSTQFGGIHYDVDNQMQAGATYGDDETGTGLVGPVEVHLVERVRQDAATVDEPGNANDTVMGQVADTPVGGETPSAEDEISAMEKEAWVMAERIRELLGRAEGYARATVWDAKARAYRPIQYRDIVVLLRSVKSRMNTVLDVFRRSEIPAYGATSTGFYGALEVQWLLSALAVIDNPRRDIDLAVVLRSPMGGFSDEELALIRTVKTGNYYEALHAVASAQGIPSQWPDAAATTGAAGVGTLLDKVRVFSRRLRAWRTLARRTQTEEVLRRILDDTDLYNYMGGMTGGRVRQGNVQVLLEKARAFDRTSYDGVHGFVTRARKALENEVDVGEARTLGENEDVVRVMTIHQSKGLEYPVVFVADLGKQFYRGTDERTFPLHRELGFGPQRTEPVSDQRWQTMASLAIDEAEMREFLAEEVRVLYVAMTRARERLILVGSARKLEECAARAADVHSPGVSWLPVSTMMRAKSYLDWLLIALFRHRDGGTVRQLAESAGWSGLFRPDEMYDHESRFVVNVWNHSLGKPLPGLGQVETGVRLNKQVLKSNDLHQLADAVYRMAACAVEDAADRVTIVEPDRLEQIPGKVSATELRRLWTSRRVHQTGGRAWLHQSSVEGLLEDPTFVRGEVPTGRESGIAFHAVMQHLDFAVEASTGGVTAELARLVLADRITSDLAEAVAVEEIVAFLRSSVGQRLRHARRVLREQPFFYLIPLADSATTDADMVLAQGVIDCLAEEADGGWLVVDYKTDRIQESDAEAKAAEYAAQLSTYVEVVRSVIPNVQVSAYLYFVKPGVAVPLQPVNLRDVF